MDDAQRTGIMAAGAVFVGTGVALAVQSAPAFGLLAAFGLLLFVWGYRRFATARLSREEFFRQELLRLTKRGLALLSFSNDQRRRSLDDWSDETFSFLLDSLGPMEATLFRDAGPNTDGLPDEVRWQQALPNQVTRLQDLLSGKLPHALLGSWQP